MIWNYIKIHTVTDIVMGCNPVSIKAEVLCKM